MGLQVGWDIDEQPRVPGVVCALYVDHVCVFGDAGVYYVSK